METLRFLLPLKPENTKTLGVPILMKPNTLKSLGIHLLLRPQKQQEPLRFPLPLKPGITIHRRFCFTLEAANVKIHRISFALEAPKQQ